MKKIELIGKEFGKLTVLSRADTKNGQIFYNCLCECGNRTVVRGDLLRKGKTRSCGCLLKASCEQFGDRVKKHFIVFGKEYGAYDLCKAFNIPTATFYRKLKSYENVEDLIKDWITPPEKEDTPSPSEEENANQE